MAAIDLTQGTARQRVPADQATTLRQAGVLALDTRRERPRYFDGRFLAARDLIRDQQYFLTREADLGRAAGSGVASGLHVSEGSTPQRLRIAAGHGVTPAGELVLLPQLDGGRVLEVALADIPKTELLSARFGLARIPNVPPRSRNGVFVLALRPVEFTANPIASYPTSITGVRTVEDGDIIEATAIVLVPWPDDGADDALDARRGRTARQVFVAQQAAGLSANVLPLAMVAMANNTVVWLDEPMVRRELGADRGDLPGLGFSPRALRLAHLLQYQEHLADVVAEIGARRFPANTRFPALPSAGPLPPGVIDPADFTQNFFPAEIDVDFAPVPDDELPAVIEDALALQPIDLTAPAEALDSTAVLVLAPVPRHRWNAVVAVLATRTRLLKPAAPNLMAQRRPLEVLQKLRLTRAAVVAPDPTNASDAQWQQLAGQANLWFVRRRHLALRDDLTGEAVALSGVDERLATDNLRRRLSDLGLAPQLDNVLLRASPLAAASVTALLSSRRLAESDALTAAALGALAEASKAAPAERAGTEAGTAAAGLDKAAVLKVAADLSAPGAGDGLVRIERAGDGQGAVTKPKLQQIASGTDWRRLDAQARTASPAELQRLSRTVLRAPVAPPPPVVAPAPVAVTPAPPTSPTPPAPVTPRPPTDVPAPPVAVTPPPPVAVTPPPPVAITPAPAPVRPRVPVAPAPVSPVVTPSRPAVPVPAAPVAPVASAKTVRRPAGKKTPRKPAP